MTTAVARQVWERLSAPDFARRVRDMGTALRAGLERLKARANGVGELRGRGLLQGFEYTGGEPKDLLARLQKRGLLALRSGTNVIRLAPPLIIDERQIQRGIEIIEEALR